MRPGALNLADVGYRGRVRPRDREAVAAIVASSGFFSPAEVSVAVELVQERLARGPRSGYCFDFAEAPDGVVGYTCFGPIPATAGAYDLYWIAVRQDYRGAGVGTRLLARTEARVRRRRGRRLYVETSSRAGYAPTRAFYAARGYEREATLADYYAPGDAKLVYVKDLTRS